VNVKPFSIRGEWFFVINNKSRGPYDIRDRCLLDYKGQIRLLAESKREEHDANKSADDFLQDDSSGHH
jgi:hypothetical protein